MTWGLGSEEDIHLGISIIISKNYTGYGDTERSGIKNKSHHMQIIVKKCAWKKHLCGQRLAQFLLVGPIQYYLSTTWFMIKSLSIAKVSQNQAPDRLSLSKENNILTLNFSYQAFFSHILFVNAIYTSLNPCICCRTSPPKRVSVSRIFWLHSKSKNTKQQQLFKQQASGTGRFF